METESEYMVFDEEVGEVEGTPHFQGYFRLAKKMYRNTIQSKANRLNINCWIDSAKGSEESNIRYCTKEGIKVCEWGELPKSVAKSLEKKDQKVKLLKDLETMSQEDFEKEHPYEAFHWANKIAQWRTTTQKLTKKCGRETCVRRIYGSMARLV